MTTPRASRHQPDEVTVAGAAVELADHVLVPAAVIAMVGALLFFLADLRSIFLPHSFALKWLGFCFGVATVLIARFGHHQRERAEVYTGLLGVAVLIALFVSPWEPPGLGLQGPLVNALIILVVWRFASRLMRGLTFEEEPPSRDPRFYGLERLEVEEFARQRGQEPRRDRPRRWDDYDPSAAVARWVVAGMALFALGEPWLLAGPPEVGLRALLAMIIFLFGAGMVLAAGSTVGTARRAWRLEGRVDRALLPGRLALAGGLLLVLLTLTLAVPGITWRGTSELAPRLGQAADHRGDESHGPGDQRGEGGKRASRDASAEPPPSTKPSQTSPQAPAGVVQVLALLRNVGRFLWIPVVVLALVGGVWVLVRLAPFLAAQAKETARWRSGWRALLARLAAFLARGRDAGETRRPRRVEIRVGDLERLAPSQAVILAYGRFLEACEAQGFGRQEKQTPYEFLACLPEELHGSREAIGELTELYVRAAYGGERLGKEARRGAIAALSRSFTAARARSSR